MVGIGKGNFDFKRDFVKFNLVDLLVRNIIGIFFGGWVVIRFVVDNLGNV